MTLETALWPLYSRAADDPIAAELVQRIGDELPRFGEPSLWLVVRERKIDAAVQRLAPRMVLSLGVGFETRGMRLGIPTVGVDLPEVIRARRSLLTNDTYRLIEGSVLDVDWSALDADVITAAGLLMYLTRDDVRQLFEALAAAFRGTAMIFDTIHPGYSALSMRGRARVGEVTLPAMPWGIAVADIPRLGEWLPVEVLEWEEYEGDALVTVRLT